MRVIKVITHEEYDDLADLLYDYIKELHNIDTAHVTLRSKSELRSEYFYSEDTHFYLIYSDKDIPVGFAITGVDSYCHALADLYIAEFYIKPEYRCQGYGKELFDSVLSLYDNHIDKICLYILKHNLNAIQFWSNLLNLDWIDVTDLYYNDTPDHLFWYMYERR